MKLTDFYNVVHNKRKVFLAVNKGKSPINFTIVEGCLAVHNHGYYFCPSQLITIPNDSWKQIESLDGLGLTKDEAHADALYCAARDMQIWASIAVDRGNEVYASILRKKNVTTTDN